MFPEIASRRIPTTFRTAPLRVTALKVNTEANLRDQIHGQRLAPEIMSVQVDRADWIGEQTGATGDPHRPCERRDNAQEGMVIPTSCSPPFASPCYPSLPAGAGEAKNRPEGPF